MSPLLLPERRRGVEFLDAPGVDPHVVRRSMADVARANQLFGGTRAVCAAVSGIVGELGDHATVLDVGCGTGDIAVRVVAEARQRGVMLEAYGVELAEPLLNSAAARGVRVVRGDARALPLADRSVDVAFCSQLLHHFAGDDAVRVLRELDRVARRCVIVSDLRRSWLAAAGIWIASFPLGFHPVSRHDGVLSVLRGYTRAELRETVSHATGHLPRVDALAAFRLTATWRPAPR